jgi:flotillin
VAEATAESIRQVNEAIQQGGESYFRYKQIEMLPDIAPAIAEALGRARLVTISSGGEAGGAADATANNITSVIQTVLAAQMVTRGGILDGATGDDASRRVAIPAVATPVVTGRTGS